MSWINPWWCHMPMLVQSISNSKTLKWLVILRRVMYVAGFGQPTYFSTVFKQYFGGSPSQYVEND